MPQLTARLRVNTDQFALLRFGLPHTRTVENGVSTVAFEVRDFAASQDIGINFVAERQDLDRVDELMLASPTTSVLLILGTLAWAQVRRVRIRGLNYGFIVGTHTFFFLFLAYLIRYLGFYASVGIALALGAVCFQVTVRPGVERGFALRTLAPLMVVLTAGYCALFLAPALKGVMTLSFFFVGFLGVLAPLARGGFESWPLLEPPPPQAPQRGGESLVGAHPSKVTIDTFHRDQAPVQPQPRHAEEGDEHGQPHHAGSADRGHVDAARSDAHHSPGGVVPPASQPLAIGANTDSQPDRPPRPMPCEHGQNVVAIATDDRASRRGRGGKRGRNAGRQRDKGAGRR